MIIDNPICPVCLLEEETVLHVLWVCPTAADVWGEESSLVKKWGRFFVDFLSLWSDFQAKLDDSLLNIVVVVLYGLWRRRNDFVFAGKFKSPSVLFQSALLDVEASFLAQQNLGEPQPRPTAELTSFVWKPPRLDFLKVNVDAAMDAKQGKLGFGIVVRDCRGDVQVVVASPKDSVSSVFVAESWAMLRAAKLCNELGLSHVQLEGDAKQVVDAINSKVLNSSWNGQVIEDIKMILSLQPRWSVSFTGREGNKAAHAAARLALSLRSECVWMVEAPAEVLPVVMTDKLCISSVD